MVGVCLQFFPFFCFVCASLLAFVWIHGGVASVSADEHDLSIVFVRTGVL